MPRWRWSEETGADLTREMYVASDAKTSISACTDVPTWCTLATLLPLKSLNGRCTRYLGKERVMSLGRSPFKGC